jgi:hypothetical protein
VAKEPTTIQQIQKLDEERARLVETVKADALQRAETAIQELRDLGFDYDLKTPEQETQVPLSRGNKPRRKTSQADKSALHKPKNAPCPICEYTTNPPHDRRSHRTQKRKKPFTDAELAERGMRIVA